MEMMPSIFIISNHIMFSYGLESLLKQEPGLKVMGQETDAAKAIKRIEEIRPDVVIIYTDEALDSSSLIIINILKVHPKAKVIGLNVQNNIFYVYQASEWTVTRWDDLVKAIRDQDLPPSSEFPFLTNNSSSNQSWEH